jgi:hypothetical protein
LAQSKDGGKSQTQAYGWIQKSVAKEIFAAAGQDLEKQMAAAKQKGFKAVPLNLTASLSFENDIARKASKNVVGIMKGTKRPEEYVLYTAHLPKPERRSGRLCSLPSLRKKVAFLVQNIMQKIPFFRCRKPLAA